MRTRSLWFLVATLLMTITFVDNCRVELPVRQSLADFIHFCSETKLSVSAVLAGQPLHPC